jgi:hypothetical protein
MGQDTKEQMPFSLKFNEFLMVSDKKRRLKIRTIGYAELTGISKQD